MPDLEIDVSEILAEGQRISVAADEIMPKVRPVLTKGAVNIKNQLQDEARASTHFKFAGLINFEQKVTANAAEAEIGPRKVGAGNLANIAYFGGSNGGGGTLPDPELALKAEGPEFEKQLGEALKGLLS